MKHSINTLSWFSAFLVLLLFAAPLQAQPGKDKGEDEVVKEDTTEITWRNKRLIITSDKDGKRFEIKEVDKDYKEDKEYEDAGEWNENEEHDYDPDHDPKVKRKGSRSNVDGLALDLGITNYYNYSTRDYAVNALGESTDLELKQFRPGSHVALHLLPTTVSIIGRGAVNLKSAITIDWNNYYFINDITLVDGGDSITTTNTGVDFTKNKLMTRYAVIPLMLNFNTDPGTKDGVSFSVGVYGGLLWKARTKQVSEENGKVKIEGEYNLNPFKYGLTARLDFKWFDIYLNYNLSELFEENQGPSTQTFMAGINIIDF